MKTANRNLLRLVFKVLSRCNALAECTSCVILLTESTPLYGFHLEESNKSNKICFFTNIHSQKLPKLGIIIGNGYKNSGLVGIYSLRLRKRLTIQHKRQ